MMRAFPRRLKDINVLLLLHGADHIELTVTQGGRRCKSQRTNVSRRKEVTAKDCINLILMMRLVHGYNFKDRFKETRLSLELTVNTLLPTEKQVHK